MNKLKMVLAILKNPTTRTLVLRVLRIRFVQILIARWALRRVTRLLSRR